MTKTIYEPGYINLVDKLRRRRLDLGLRQKDVAATLGVKRNWVSKVELREIRLDVWQFVGLCAALNLDPASTLLDFIEGVTS